MAQPVAQHPQGDAFDRIKLVSFADQISQFDLGQFKTFTLRINTSQYHAIGINYFRLCKISTFGDSIPHIA